MELIEIFIGLGAGLVLFLCTIKAYTLGLKHGKQLGNATIPTMDINPVKAYTEHMQAKEEKKQHDFIEEGINNIMSYTGESQKEGE